MYQTKILASTLPGELEKSVNEFLNDKNPGTLIDIKYSVVQPNFTIYTAMVIYIAN